MKKVNRIIWGIVLVAIGVVFALNALEITNFDLFFDGWWTLFILVPCTISLFTTKDRTGSIIGILVGVLLLLACQDIIDFSLTWKLIVPAIIILIGLKLIFRHKSFEIPQEVVVKATENGQTVSKCSVVFSGKTLDYTGEVFEGAEYSAVFGGIKCDIRNAVIEKDVAIDINAIFGGIDIYVPANVNVKVGATGVFGGVENAHINNAQAQHTIYITGNSIFGGAEIK